MIDLKYDNISYSIPESYSHAPRPHPDLSFYNFHVKHNVTVLRDLVIKTQHHGERWSSSLRRLNTNLK